MDSRLNHLVALARSGSFTAAAQMVGVTQSAVTKSVAELERQLGYSLFSRTSRGALLTEKGREFAERAARLLDDARELFDGAANNDDRFAGILRVGVCPASLEWRLARPLGGLLKRHPSIRFEVSSASFERMVQQLRNGSVDVALGFDAAFRDWPDLDREQVAAPKTRLFVRKAHPLFAGATCTLADLASYDFVSPSESRPYAEVIRNIYESQGVDWRKRLHFVDCFSIVGEIVAASNAVGVVPLSHSQTPAFQAKFSTLEHLAPFPPGPLCCAVRARWEPKPAVRAFIAAVRDDLADARAA
ncbi:MAG: LysR family transcriptional regulator [Devosia sp.]|nr:LysR family transcriptional regulator [Devosia sp.]